MRTTQTDWAAMTAEAERRRREREADPEWQAREAERKEQARRARADAIRRAVSVELADAGVPPKDLALIASGELAVTPGTDAVNGAHTLLVLSGMRGCGKTVAASTWLHRWAADVYEQRQGPDDANVVRPVRGLGAVFVTAARLSRWSRYDDAAMDRLIKAPRLVIDDLGAEFMDERGSYLCLLDEVVNERYAAARPTVMTTNLGAPEFRERYGERIADRIREAGRFVSLPNPSMRSRRP